MRKRNCTLKGEQNLEFWSLEKSLNILLIDILDKKIYALLFMAIYLYLFIWAWILGILM